jgi:hypothetical protein
MVTQQCLASPCARTQQSLAASGRSATPHADAAVPLRMRGALVCGLDCIPVLYPCIPVATSRDAVWLSWASVYHHLLQSPEAPAVKRTRMKRTRMKRTLSSVACGARSIVCDMIYDNWRSLRSMLA